MSDTREFDVVVPADTTPSSATSYSVRVGAGALRALPEVLRARGLDRGTLAVVTDTNVARYHLSSMVQRLDEAGLRYTFAMMPAGEAHKTLNTVHGLGAALASAGVDRSGAVVAFGGGVVGDVAGYLAASYMRGIPVVQVPTSLLGMVDASIGGKTGVDLVEGKNLMGAFHHPHAVLADPNLLATLPREEFVSGCAEVIKHGIIGSDLAPALFERLEAHPLREPADVEPVLADAMAVKVDVVSEDPSERGRRALLNLGHTFGHALERVRSYEIRHGEAVAIGTLAACRYAAASGQTTDPELGARVRALVEAHRLPVVDDTLDESAVNALIAAMSTDKKRDAGRLRLIVPRAIGDVFVDENVDTDALREAVASMVG